MVENEANVYGANTVTDGKFIVNEYDPFEDKAVIKLKADSIKPTLWIKKVDAVKVDELGDKVEGQVIINHRLSIAQYQQASKSITGSGLYIEVDSLAKFAGPVHAEEITGKNILMNVDGENIELSLTNNKVDRITDDNKKTIGLKSIQTFEFNNESDFEKIVNSTNLELRYMTNTGTFDLDEAVEKNIAEAFKVFYNQVFDESKFQDLLPSDEDIELYKKEYAESLKFGEDGGIIAAAITVISILVILWWVFS